MKFDPYLTPLAKMNLKWIKDLNIRRDNIKLLEEDTENKLLYIGLGTNFFWYMTKSTGNKRKKSTSGTTSSSKASAWQKKQSTKWKGNL